MARYLMTHSLLSSWLYLMKENPYEDMTTESDPMAEFMQVLRREPTPTNDIDGTNNANARSRFRIRDKKHIYRERDRQQTAYM